MKTEAGRWNGPQSLYDGGHEKDDRTDDRRPPARKPPLGSAPAAAGNDFSVDDVVGIYQLQSPTNNWHHRRRPTCGGTGGLDECQRRELEPATGPSPTIDFWSAPTAPTTRPGAKSGLNSPPESDRTAPTILGVRLQQRVLRPCLQRQCASVRARRRGPDPLPPLRSSRPKLVHRSR